MLTIFRGVMGLAALFLIGCGDQLGMGLMNAKTHHHGSAELSSNSKQFVGKKPLLADRHYMESVFENVFLPEDREKLSAENKAIFETIHNQVVRRPAAFGGPCAKVDEAFKAGTQRLCTDSTASFDKNPSASTPRQGYKIKACEALTNRDQAIKNAVAKVQKPMLAPNVEAMTGAYQLFYPGYALAENGLASLQDLVTQLDGEKPIDQWRAVFLGICLSTGWEIL